jgi:hypothetical protein
MIAKIISTQSNGLVSVAQYLTDQADTIEYISCNEAMDKNYIEVKEISESGSVNNLVVLNHSTHLVFFSDGDILSGAKQNRILNTSVLLAPNSKTIVPVSCVEQGRWRHISPKFKGNDYLAPSKLRAKKSEQVKENLKTNSGFLCSQHSIWSEVEEHQTILRVNSPTSNLSDVFEEKRGDIDNFIADFKVEEEANGMTVFINKNILSVDTFNRTNIYKEYFQKILRGVSSEAIYLKKTNSVLEEAEIKFKTLNFFDELEKSKSNIYPGVGVGNERRFDSDKISGFNLFYSDQTIHLTASEIKN